MTDGQSREEGEREEEDAAWSSVLRWEMVPRLNNEKWREAVVDTKERTVCLSASD